MNDATQFVAAGGAASVCAPCFAAIGLDPTLAAFVGAAFAIVAPRAIAWARDRYKSKHDHKATARK